MQESVSFATALVVGIVCVLVAVLVVAFAFSSSTKSISSNTQQKQQKQPQPQPSPSRAPPRTPTAKKQSAKALPKYLANVVAEVLPHTPDEHHDTLHAAANRLAEIHKTQLVHGSWCDELKEQLLGMMFVADEDVVVEIGANIGRNTCALAARLKGTGYRMLSFETIVDNERALRENLVAIQAQERVSLIFAALSSRRLCQKGWDAFPCPDGAPSDALEVATTDWKRAQTQLGDRRPTAIVADCEGAMLPILKDFPDMLDGIQTIVMENDFFRGGEEEFRKLLQDRGYRSIVQWPLNDDHPRFYEAWKLI